MGFSYRKVRTEIMTAEHLEQAITDIQSDIDARRNELNGEVEGDELFLNLVNTLDDLNGELAFRGSQTKAIASPIRVN